MANASNLSLVLLSLFIGVLILSSLLTVASATTPTVPEFKLSWTTRVYDEPAATSQWSGEITWPGSHTEVRQVTIKIKNQPHEDYINGDINGAKEKLYYNIRVKSHASSVWTEFWGATTFYGGATGVTYQGSSDTEVTYITLDFSGPHNIIHSSTDVNVGNQVDYQVKALIGYLNYDTHVFTGQESAWSNTQTLTIDASAQTTSSPSPEYSNSTTEPTQSAMPSSTWYPTEGTSVPLSIFIAVTVTLLAVIVILLVFYRHPKQ